MSIGTTPDLLRLEALLGRERMKAYAHELLMIDVGEM